MMASAHRAREYLAVSLTSRVQGADAHELVQILFDELLRSLDAGERAILTADLEAKSRHLSRAQALLHALDDSLDHVRGGDVAVSLGVIYGHARRAIVRAITRNSAEDVRAAREPIGEIAGAWRQLRAKAAPQAPRAAA